MKIGRWLMIGGLVAGLGPGSALAGLADVLALAREQEWTAAEEIAGPKGSAVNDILLWHRLREGVGEFEEFLGFLESKGDWPGLVRLRRLGERTITHQTPRDEVLRYFRHRHAGSAHGALHLADALVQSGNTDRARAEIVLAWRNLSFSRSEQAIFQKEFGDLLKPHTFARLDRLLWRGQKDQAQRLYPFLTPGERALARARIVLREKGRGVDARIKRVPEDLAEDPGLAFERFLWRMEKGRQKGAEEVILARSDSAERLGEPSFWASHRRVLARQAMRDGRDQVAYDLAANHHLTSGNHFADLEWLAGYIALRRLDDATLALRHFRRFRAGVDSPISMGRAGYWEAQAYFALDRPVDAQAALEFGAEFQTGFYGLLAAQAAGIEMQPEIVDPRPQPIDAASFLGDDRLIAATMLADAGEKALSAYFYTHVFDHLDKEDQRRLGDLALLVEEPHAAVTLGKLSASRGDVLPRPYFPIVQVDGPDVPPELILSIIRRESEFNPAAISRAGARGLMQLMPKTAQEVAGDLGEGYDLEALTGDTAYNMRLGTEYLRYLGGEFDDNILLVASAYNAGPTRTNSWLKAYGDPRSRAMDPLDWIEMIPFRETRNYVMRVAESVVIYRARLAGEIQEIRLADELKE